MPSAGGAGQGEVVLSFEEVVCSELLDQGFIDRRGGKVEVGPSLAVGNPRNTVSKMSPIGRVGDYRLRTR